MLYTQGKWSTYFNKVYCILYHRSADKIDAPSPSNNIPLAAETKVQSSPAIANSTASDVMISDTNEQLRNWTAGSSGIATHSNTQHTMACSSSQQQQQVVMQPADTTVQENAITAQKIVDKYLKMTAPPVHRKDMNYGFPPGLFPSEVDLEGSAQAYHSLIDGLENCTDIQQLLNQVDADPFRSTSIFSELDLDIFD